MGRGLDDRLGRWTAAGVISAEQAMAIARLEGARRSLHPLAEAAAYGGAMLVLAAASALVSRFWGALTVPGQAGLLAAVAVLLLAAGWWLDEGPADRPGGGEAEADAAPDDDLLPDVAPARRLLGFLWTGAVLAGTGAVGLLADEGFGGDGLQTVLVVGTAAAVGAGALWARRRGVLLLVTAWAGLLTAAGAALGLADVEPVPLTAALYVLGAVGGLLVWGGVLGPRRTGWTLASLTVLCAAQSLVFETDVAGLVVAVVTAVAVCAAGARLREFVLLAFGVVGVGVFVPQTFDDLGVDEIGAAGLTLVVGLVVLVVGVLTVRRGRTSDEPATTVREPSS